MSSILVNNLDSENFNFELQLIIGNQLMNYLN